MNVRKWKRWKGKNNTSLKCKKRKRLIIRYDNLQNAKRPPDWMQELLFEHSDDDVAD